MIWLILLCLAICATWLSSNPTSHTVAARTISVSSGPLTTTPLIFELRHIVQHDLDCPTTHPRPQNNHIQIADVSELVITGKLGRLRPAELMLRTKATVHAAPADERAQVPPNTHVLQLEGALPNTTDKDTVINLAKMTSDAYLFDPGDATWFNTSLGFNYTCGFGWNDDGLRGNIFTTEDESVVVVAYKGTSIKFRDGLSSRDRINDITLFSCCCGAQNPYRYAPVCNCSTGYYTGDSSCLTKSVLQSDSYYNAAVQVMHKMKQRYPHATFWTTGHSLGGSLASLVGLTFDIPAVTFEAPPDRLPAGRMGLIHPRNPMAYHFGHTADPVFMGSCNGFSSLCSFWGFSFESQCFTGKRCQYETVRDKGWHVSIANHRINYVIENVLQAYDTVPDCESDESYDCQDCFNYKFTPYNDTSI